MNPLSNMITMKDKLKLRGLKNRTVSLLVDKVYLEPYFVYQDGINTNFSYNTNEAATSNSAFILSRVFSQYKHVMHVKPN